MLENRASNFVSHMHAAEQHSKLQGVVKDHDFVIFESRKCMSPSCWYQESRLRNENFCGVRRNRMPWGRGTSICRPNPWTGAVFGRVEAGSRLQEFTLGFMLVGEYSGLVLLLAAAHLLGLEILVKEV